MRILNWTAGVIFSLVLLVLAQHINNSRTYDLEQVSEFLAMCGTFIQTGFGSNKPGTWDYFLVLISTMVVLVTLWFSVKYLIKPEERDDHIKFKILEDEKAH